MQGGDVFGGEGRIHAVAQSVFQRRQRQLVDAQHARQMVLLDLVDVLLFADEHARLGGAQQLVAGEGDHVRPGAQALAGHMALPVQAEVLAGEEKAGAQVVQQQRAFFPGDGAQLLDLHGLGKAADFEVAGVHLQQRLGAAVNGIDVVIGVGLVGGADFHERGTAARHDLRHTEGAADFHQLAPGDGHGLALAEGVEHEKDRAGVVVDDHGGLGPRDLTEQALDVGIAAAALALFQVVFKVAVPGGYGGHMLRCLPAQGCAAQVGVQDHAGGVDDTAQRIIIAMPEPFQNLRGKRRGGGDGVSRAGQQGLAEGLGFLLQEFPHEYIGVLLAGPADFGQSQQTVNFWDPAEKSVVHDRVLLLKAL